GPPSRRASWTNYSRSKTSHRTSISAPGRSAEWSPPEPYGFICRLLVETGLRWGELTRAKASDVTGSSLVVSQTKSGKVRRVPLSSEVQSELRTRVGK